MTHAHLEDALSLLNAAARIELRVGNLRRIPMILGRCAHAHARLQRAETAGQMLARPLSVYQEIGAIAHFTAPENEETLALLRAQLDEEAFDLARKQGQTLTLEDAVALAAGEVKQDA